MKNTRFMEVLFSAVENEDEVLAGQVAQDIEDARENGVVDTDEVTYKGRGDGTVSITDKETGEVTIAEKANDEAETYDLYPAEMTEQLEGYLHPAEDGVTPSMIQGVPAESISNHFAPAEDVRQFSVLSDNVIVQRIFSEQEFCERLFSEVIESEETAKVGDLKVEKLDGEDYSVLVTSEATGDQAKVSFDGDEMEVTELESKNFGDLEGEVCEDDQQYLPLYVVGVDTFNHIIVDAPAYTEEDAQDLAHRLMEKGVEAVQIVGTAEEARDYAISLLNSLGVEEEMFEEQVEEPEQVEFSDHVVSLTKFYSDNNNYMVKLFSETVNEIETSQDAIEDAIESGDQIENESEIITPIDAKTAVVEDKETGEFTKVVLVGDAVEADAISSEEAEELTSHLVAGEEDEEEKNFSDIYCDEAETKFFSESEELTNYMVRLFSEEADSSEIEDAIESGEQVENESEVITPIDAKTAIIEDKETGEFTKAIMDDEVLDVQPISEEEADELTENIAVSDEEKVFSDIYCDEAETKFFSESEEMTNYMVRLFSEEADSGEIEDAIEAGEVVENESEIITPISETEAIIEDKETGEFTKAIIDGETLDIQPLTEEEADKLEKESEKQFSTGDDMLDKFFSEVQPPAPEDEEDKPTLEAIEDKALAAIQSIQDVTEEATAAIMEAKEAPAGTQGDLKEAQFSENNSENCLPGTLATWMTRNKIGK